MLLLPPLPPIAPQAARPHPRALTLEGQTHGSPIEPRPSQTNLGLYALNSDYLRRD